MGWFAPLIGAAASGLIGALGTKKGSSGGYDMIQPEWMPGMEALSGQAADYYAMQLQRMREGKEPEWWSKYAPLIRRRQTRGLEEAMYGLPGERTGAYSGQMQAGALAGLGGGQTTARTRPLYSEYLNKSQAIDEAMAAMSADIMQRGEQTYLQGVNAMSKFKPQPQIQERPATPPTTSPWASVLGNIVGGIGSGSINLSSLFGGAGNTPQLSNMISSIGQTPASGTLRQTFSSLNNPFSTGISWGGRQY